MGEGWKRAIAAAKATRDALKMRCPHCTKMIARGKDWAPGYPTLRRHKDFGGKWCCTGYLRQSKVDGRWICE